MAACSTPTVGVLGAGLGGMRSGSFFGVRTGGFNSGFTSASLGTTICSGRALDIVSLGKAFTAGSFGIWGRGLGGES